MMDMAGARPRAAGMIAVTVAAAVTLWVAPAMAPLLLNRARDDVRIAAGMVHAPRLPSAAVHLKWRPAVPAGLAVTEVVLVGLALAGLAVVRPRPLVAIAPAGSRSIRGPPRRDAVLR
jgi:hypothetical protein